MTNSQLQLAAVTQHPRHALVALLVDALNSVGSVLDSHPFSNLALAVQFEVSAQRVVELRPALLALPLSFSRASITALDSLETIPESEVPVDMLGSIHITFVHNEPDLRMHIPAVPG